MKELKYQLMPNTEFVQPAVLLTFRGGKEHYLCNDYDDVRDAFMEGKPFAAHEVKGMKPAEMVINPDAVASVTQL